MAIGLGVVFAAEDGLGMGGEGSIVEFDFSSGVSALFVDFVAGGDGVLPDCLAFPACIMAAFANDSFSVSPAFMGASVLSLFAFDLAFFVDEEGGDLLLAERGCPG
jgi:hypothetical protein